MTALRKTLRGVSLCVYAAAQAALALGLAAAMLLRVLAQRFPYASLHYLFAHRASLALFSRRELLAAAGMAAGVLAVIALLSRFALRTQLCFTVGTRRVRFGLLSAKTMWAAALLAAALVWGFVWVTCPLRVQPYWYEQYGLIAHAGGGITVDGRQYSYTNSREAVEQSYAAGHRVIELDFALTSDEYLVCTHDWADFHADPADRDVPVTKAEFMKSKPTGGGILSPLDAEGVIDIMIKYPDLYIMTDSKDCVHKDTAQAALLYLVQTAQSKNAEDVLSRLIVQCAHYEYIDWAREVYPFENYLFTIYKIGIGSYDMGIGSYPPLTTEYCDAKQICVITMPYEWYLKLQPEQDHNPPQVLCLNTVNDKQLALQLRESGADIFYTDFLLPEDFAPAA